MEIDIKLPMSDEYIGKKVICTLNGTPEIECLVSKEDGIFYLLQNSSSGANAKDKKGYTYSWGVVQDCPIKDYGVSSMRLVGNTIDNYLTIN